MKDLSSKECSQVSGGEQFLSITSKIEFEGIPCHCVESFFNAHKDNFANITLDTLDKSIISECSGFDLTNYSISMDVTPVSISLVDII